MTLPNASVAISTPTTPVTIASDGTTYRLSTLGRPGVTWRATYAPDSPDMAGSVLLNAVKETSALPFQVIVQGSSMANLEASIDVLSAALDQLTCNLTATVGGVGRVWTTSGPAAYGSVDGEYDAGRVAQFFDVLAVTFPVYPIPGSVT